MIQLAGKLARLRYLVQRVAESPPSFLARKLSIELGKRLERGRVLRAASTGRSFSAGYERHAGALLELARSLRADLLVEAEAAGLDGEPSLHALAQDFDARRFRCLGYGSTSLEPGHWARDDFHDYGWPKEYFARIDYVAARERCDVKVPWELSRMQWLARAAFADALDPRAARRQQRLERIELLLEDWLRENPYGIGINWVSAMEVAIRAVNLLAALVLLVDRLRPECRDKLLVSLGEHRHYLLRYPETSDVQGNHHLATELGLFFLEAFRAGHGRCDAAAARFVAACELQFEAQGLHVEFAPIYHRLSLDMVRLGQALMQRVCARRAPALDGLLQRARACCRILANERGELPLFGDHDSGQVLDFGQSTRVVLEFTDWRARPRADAAAPGASARCRSESLGAALLTLWHRALAGDEARDTASSEASNSAGNSAGNAASDPARDAARDADARAEEGMSAPARGRVTRLAPFSVLERARAKLVVRAGPLGLAGRASHDHEDQLSIWYSWAGRDLIVESGCPPYTREPAERLAGVSSRAHNLITLDGLERHRATAGSVCATLRGAPVAELLSSNEESGQAASASSCVDLRLLAPEGRSRGGCPREHRRRIELSAGGQACVSDRVDCVGAESFEARWHFAPGCGLELGPAGQQRLLDESGELLLRIECVGSVPLQFRVEAYDFHSEYGASEGAQRLVVSGSAREAFELWTRFAPAAEADELERVSSLLEGVCSVPVQPAREASAR